MCLTCPPPVWPTHVLSLFRMPFWWVSRVNLQIPTAMRPSYMYLLSFLASSVDFLQHRFPHMMVQKAHNLNFKLICLRYDFKNCFCYVTLRNTFLDRQNQWGGLTKSDIPFDPFDTLWWNFAVIRRNELPWGLYNFILKFQFLAEILEKNRRGSFFLAHPV